MCQVIPLSFLSCEQALIKGLFITYFQTKHALDIHNQHKCLQESKMHYFQHRIPVKLCVSCSGVALLVERWSCCRIIHYPDEPAAP